jgi:4-hydroxy-3-polyprenylbenzoate decarboxylase
MNQRLIVGISGASGVIHGIRLLEVLRQRGEIETHLVLTRPAERTIVEETDWKIDDVKALAGVVHSPSDIGASIASGSFQTIGMVVMPCSIHTAAAIAYCNADNLLTRAADVMLKERRKLVLVVRETPFHRGHLKAMLEATPGAARAKRMIARGIDGLSIGFVPVVVLRNGEGRVLVEIELLEVSIVTHPMQPQARLTLARELSRAA